MENNSLVILKMKGNSPIHLKQDERTSEPEDLIALATYLGGPLLRSHSMFDGNMPIFSIYSPENERMSPLKITGWFRRTSY